MGRATARGSLSCTTLLTALVATTAVLGAGARRTLALIGENNLFPHRVNILHGSNPNPSGRPRVGFALRFTAPRTRQVQGEPPTAVLARGRDRYHRFELLPAPPALDLEDAVAAQ